MKKENEDIVLFNNEYHKNLFIKKINTQLKKMNEVDLEDIYDLLKSRSEFYEKGEKK